MYQKREGDREFIHFFLFFYFFLYLFIFKIFILTFFFTIDHVVSSWDAILVGILQMYSS